MRTFTLADIFDLFRKIEKSPSAAAGGPITHLVCGLGNPGDNYRHTRHNAGFLAIDYLEQAFGAKCDRIKFHALTGEARLGEHRVLLLKPQTFMNNSGEAIREAANFHKIAPENILVIYDDIHLAPGRMRIRRKGSDGGHNGIKSILYHLGSDTFPRVKLGVGENPYPPEKLPDWVLSKFTEEDKKALFDCFEPLADAVRLIVNGEIDLAMNRYSR